MNYRYLSIYVLSIVLVISYFLGFLPLIIFFIFIISSLLTYWLYAKDKRASINGEWRTPENRLHLFSLFFGWPGAIVAQHKLRHKTKKQTFRFVFILTIILNIAFIAALHSNEGNQIIRNYTYKLENFVSANIKDQKINAAVALFLKFRKSSYTDK